MSEIESLVDVKTTFEDFYPRKHKPGCHANFPHCQQNQMEMWYWRTLTLTGGTVTPPRPPDKSSVLLLPTEEYIRGRLLAERLCGEGSKPPTSSPPTSSPSSSYKGVLLVEGVMANGIGVMAEVGTSFTQIALLADFVGIPVLICCQTFIVTERVQTDSLWTTNSWIWRTLTQGTRVTC